MTREEQIKKLTEELVKLIETPSVSETESVKYTKTINDLKNGLNVDVGIVKQIMRRVDEVYGKCENYQYTPPLFDEFDKIIKG